MRGRSSTGTFRLLVEHMPAVVHISALDESSSTLYISPQVEELLGYTPREWVEDPGLWARVVHPEDRNRIMAGHLAHLASGGVWADEYRLVRRDGRTVWVREHSALISNEAGEPQFEQGVWLDITERKQAEEDLIRSYQALQKTDQARRRLLATLVTAQEQERRRIAGDIHDDALQHLAVTLLQVELADRSSEGLKGERLAELRQNLRTAIESLRRVLFETRPPLLDEAGLVPALRIYLRQIASESSFRYEVRSTLTREPVGQVRTVAYRIVQEAVSNIRKHAAAKMVSVTLMDDGDGVLVRVRDNGRGFTSGDVVRAGRTHIGLLSMRERAELAGGWLEIKSTPGSGTTVVFWLPVRSKRTAAMRRPATRAPSRS
ncbi:MAG TPA: PAS domain-containing protein [Actinomycetota bacterium]|nr:PAS domain-containing protein [Actinomycetota bacterium]